MIELGGNGVGMIAMILMGAFLCMNASSALARGSAGGGGRGGHTHCRHCGSTVSHDDTRCPSCDQHLDD